MRVLIVGGGAAGLCCAIRLRQLDPAVQVTVLERLEQPGKKLLATGNGRCNLTNMQAPHSRAVLDFFASRFDDPAGGFGACISLQPAGSHGAKFAAGRLSHLGRAPGYRLPGGKDHPRLYGANG